MYPSAAYFFDTAANAVLHGRFQLESSVLAASYFRPVGLSSPQLRFTSVFGMRTGGATAPNHQNGTFKFIPQSNANNV